MVGGEPTAAAAPAFTFRTLGGRQVKGKSAPVDVWRLEGHAQAAAATAVYVGELIGRDNELTALTEFLLPVLTGQFAGLAYVFGEPGMGKSRLVHELRLRLDPAPGEGAELPPAVQMADDAARQAIEEFIVALRRAPVA